MRGHCLFLISSSIGASGRLCFAIVAFPGWLVGLEFNGPVNTIIIMSSRRAFPVYLHLYFVCLIFGVIIEYCCSKPRSRF